MSKLIKRDFLKWLFGWVKLLRRVRLMQLENLFQIGRCTIDLENLLSEVFCLCCLRFSTFCFWNSWFFLFYLILNVSVKFLESSDRKPHNLTNLLSEEEFFELWNKDRKLRKLFEDMRQVYWEVYHAGFKIAPDSFGGFRFMTSTGEKIRPGEISCAVGLLGNQPKGRFLDDWLLMEGDKLLVGVARWANHLCRPNCNYYMAGGFNGGVWLRLRY